MSFSPDHANPDYNPNYDTPSPKSSDIEGRAKNASKGRMRRGLPRDRIKRVAQAMEHEPSLEKKPCNGLFCGLFKGGKRRTKKRRKKRRTKSRRKTKRRRKSRRRTKRRRRKR